MSSENNYEFDFETADAGASRTHPCVANDLRTGGFVLLNGDKPCKITSIAKSKPGKHGHAKVVVCGVDIFTGKKYDGGGPASHNMTVPNISRWAYLVLGVGRDGYLTLFDVAIGDEKIDVKVPEGELGERVRKMFEVEKKQINVVVLKAMDQEIVVDVQERKDDD